MRVIAAAALASLAILVAARGATAIVCANDWETVEDGAAQAVAGQHPLWADAYLVGRVVHINRPAVNWESTVLTVSVEVLFSSEFPASVELAIGPHGPDFGYAEGRRYFLSIHRSIDPQTDHDLYLAPCAPTFEITWVEQLDRLLAASPSENVVARPEFGETGLPGGVVLAGLLGFALLGLSVLAFRKRAP